MSKLSDPVYLEKVKKLKKSEAERLFSRMSGKLPREDALALQMELEDEQLQEWRARMSELKQQDEKKEKSGSKAAANKAVSGKDKPAGRK